MITETEFIVKCPHCGDEIIIEKLNCCIFRHGIYKHNLQQIPPHAPKNICDELVNTDQIFGCGKPFRIIMQGQEQEQEQEQKKNYIAIICEYI